ncbi:MAG: sigma-70 family RNA polymerase sigma factor [Symploca sp. SIO3E6]|nr:sigma-70 family RNA polymerase sigma factor [Caldora sp. SIO3E6]
MTKQENDIIKEFSEFRIYVDRQKLEPDPKLARKLKSLVDVAAFRGNQDAWARYFLLLAAFYGGGLGNAQGRGKKKEKAKDRLILDILRETFASSSLESLIEYLVKQASEPNQGVQTIYHQLVAGQNSLEVAKFLSNPAPDANAFLVVHLQKIGWYAARKFYTQRIDLSPSLKQRYPLEECCQIANQGASQPTKLLKQFDFQYKNTIKTYANARIFGVVKNKIDRDNLQARTKSFSDYGLLRHIRKKELREALTSSGNGLIQCFCLAIQCYQEIYQPRQNSSNRLQPPTQEQLQAIAARYNQLRQQFNLSESATGESIQDWLLTAAQAVRDYRSQSVDCSTEYVGELGNDLPDSIDALIQTEAIAHLKTAFEQAFSGLPKPVQDSLRLWLGLGFTQEDVARLFGSSLGWQTQSQFSRNIGKYRKKILPQAVIQNLSKTYPEILGSPKKIDQISSRLQDEIKEYTREFCQSYFYPPLAAQWQQLEQEERLILERYHRLRWDEQQIAEKLNSSVSEVKSKLSNSQEKLRTSLELYIETTFNIQLSVCNSAQPKLTKFVEMWLVEEGREEAPRQSS